MSAATETPSTPTQVQTPSPTSTQSTSAQQPPPAEQQDLIDFLSSHRPAASHALSPLQQAESPAQPEPPAQPEAQTSHTRRQSAHHIKRPCNAFILFRSHAVTTNLVPKEVERDHRNISRIISHMWHNLNADERKMWEMQADIEKQRHRQQHPNYKYRPSSRRHVTNRRNIRRLSSTERQCERIADAILKSCGREGVTRHRPPKRSPRRPAALERVESNDSAFTSSPSLPPSPAWAIQSNASSPFRPNMTMSPQRPAGLRRSSSAPPCHTTLLKAPCPDTREMNEAFRWLFDASTVSSHQSQVSTPSDLVASSAATTPHFDPCWHSSVSPAGSAPPPLRDRQVESPASTPSQTPSSSTTFAPSAVEQLEHFSLGPSALLLTSGIDDTPFSMAPTPPQATAPTPGSVVVSETPAIPPLFLPPVSPKTRLPADGHLLPTSIMPSMAEFDHPPSSPWAEMDTAALSAPWNPESDQERWLSVVPETHDWMLPPPLLMEGDFFHMT